MSSEPFLPPAGRFCCFGFRGCSTQSAAPSRAAVEGFLPACSLCRVSRVRGLEDGARGKGQVRVTILEAPMGYTEVNCASVSRLSTMTTSSLGSWARAERGGTRLLASVGKPSFGVCGDCESFRTGGGASTRDPASHRAPAAWGFPRPSREGDAPSQPSGEPSHSSQLSRPQGRRRALLPAGARWVLKGCSAGPALVSRSARQQRRTVERGAAARSGRRGMEPPRAC